MPWDIGGWELFVLAVVTIIVVGPRELPAMLRSVGSWMSKARSMAREFQRSFDEMARETELDQLRKEVNDLRTNNPLSDLKKDLQRSIDPRDSIGADAIDEFGGEDPSATSGSTKNSGEAKSAGADSHGQSKAESDEPQGNVAAKQA